MDALAAGLRRLGLRRLAHLGAAVDGASLGVYRALFGLLMAAGCLRFVLSGWVEKLYEEPAFFFKYRLWGWGWLERVEAWPAPFMSVHYGVLVALALAIAAGLAFRPAALLFALGFAFVQLVDQTNYLNHYYLAVLLAGLMATMPLGRLSLRRLLRYRQEPASALSSERDAVPRWCLWLLRTQVATVYVYAALAKMQSDWLWHGMPLGIWLQSRRELPILGDCFAYRETALAMSWAGFLYDLTIPLWLSWSRTRAAAFVIVLVFHGLTLLLFDIGLFPWIMTISATLFFSPSWPRRVAAWCARRARHAPQLLAAALEPGTRSGPNAVADPSDEGERARTAATKAHTNPGAWLTCSSDTGRGRMLHTATTLRTSRAEDRTLAAITTARDIPRRRSQRCAALLGPVLGAAYLTIQVLVPARHWLLPGNVLWNELGMRWSWQVLVREKNGSVAFRVVDPQSGGTWWVSPTRYLQWRQFKEMSGQPDLIWQLAQRIGDDFRARAPHVQVFADAMVSLNGRPAAAMIDPKVDLLSVRDEWTQAPWVLPHPGGDPPRLGRSLW